MEGAGRGFGSVATAYERFRLDYPSSVVERLVAYAQPPPSTVLEIGAGTGKLTRLFDAYGLSVTATDPDPAMLEELRRHVSARVETTCAPFEDLPFGEPVDVVAAAASLHWTRAEGRWARISRFLRPGGTLVCCGGSPKLADPDLAVAVRRACGRWSGVSGPAPDGSERRWPATELDRSAQFSDVLQHVIPQRVTVPVADYVGYLSTVSTYLRLPAGMREAVLDTVAGVLPPVVELDAELTLHLARRTVA